MKSPASQRYAYQTNVALAAAIIAVPAGFAARAVAAPADKPLVFDALSIKPSPGATAQIRDNGGGRLRFSPGRVVRRFVTARRMILEAYHLGDAQLITGGPGWLDAAKFDIECKTEMAATAGELRQMLQAMLADRFKLRVHHQKKEMPIYALTVAKNGAKLVVWKEGDPMPQGTPPPGKIAGVLAFSGTVEQFAEELSRHPDIGRPVLDMTDIQGSYLFRLGWEAESNIMIAVQEQLGIHFDSRRAYLDVLYIDGVEMPGEN
jgi:uncharacterized protein (TIGR03435 family)